MSDSETGRLAVLREKVAELARTLGMDLPSKRSDQTDLSPAGPTCVEAIRVAIAKSWMLARKHRNKLLGDSFFYDPAWDIMLDLYEQHHAGRVVTVTSACLASRAPVSTAFRQLGRLERAGWVVRSDDSVDGRKVHVTLTERALATMDELMDHVLTTEQRLLTTCGAGDLPGIVLWTKH